MRLPVSIRAVGARLLRWIPVRILAGPNAGLRWSLASAGRGYRSGGFEMDRMHAIDSLVMPGAHVWDVGAHKGYVSMALSRRVGPSGSVSAFEPSRENLWFLSKHLAWNQLENVRAFPLAITDGEGVQRFGGDGSSITFRLGQGSETVRATSLTIVQSEHDLPAPDAIKIDVEGNEGAVLRGAGDLLSDHVLLLISIHDRACYDDCISVLSERGYRLYPSVALAARLADPEREWGADHELLAVGRSNTLKTEDVRRLALFAEVG